MAMIRLCRPPGFSLVPSEGLRTVSRCRRVVTAPSATSHGVTCASQCCKRQRIGLFGLPDPAMASPFPSRLRGIPIVPVCRPLSCPAHPVVRFRSSSRVSRVTAGPGANVRDSFPGLSSLIAASFCGVHSRGRPRPATFRPRRFSRPRRLPPPQSFAGLFHPATTSRVRSSGVFPGEKPHGLVARRCPLVVYALPLPPVLPMGSRTPRPPSGLCSAHQSVANRGGLDRDLLAPLLSFSPPSGSPSHTARATFTALSDHSLSRPSSC